MKFLITGILPEKIRRSKECVEYWSYNFREAKKNKQIHQVIYMGIQILFLIKHGISQHCIILLHSGF